MRHVKTRLTDRCFKLPGGTEENDLWVAVKEDEDSNPVLCSVWEPTQEERAAILDGANIELMVWGQGTPPVAVGLTTEESTNKIRKPK